MRVVTGAGKVNLGAGFDGDTIDASANTGGLTTSITTGVTKSVTGSAAADAVPLVGSLTSAGKLGGGQAADPGGTGRWKDRAADWRYHPGAA